MEKVKKREANYRDSQKSAECCGVCYFYSCGIDAGGPWYLRTEGRPSECSKLKFSPKDQSKVCDEFKER